MWYWHKKKVHRTIEQNREFKNNSQLYDDESMQQGENLLQQMIVGKSFVELDSNMQKNQTGLLSYTIYQSEIKVL